jgi:hypothetical protein
MAMNKVIKIVFNDDIPQTAVNIVSDRISVILDELDLTAVQFVSEEEAEVDDA